MSETLKAKPKTAVERFWANVDKRGPDDCWLWTASRKPFGYGQMMIAGKMKRAHRYSWELASGSPPDGGLSVCHSCDNPPCVNPKHLYLGTQGDNIREAERKGRLFRPNAHKTHCPSGHPYDLENTRIQVKKGYTYRVCRECRRLYDRKRAAQSITASSLPGQPDTQRFLA